MESLTKEINALLHHHPREEHHAVTPLPEPSTQQVQELKTKHEKAKQEQVFAFWDELNKSEKSELYAQLNDLITPDEANKLYRSATKSETHADAVIEPIPESATYSTVDSKEKEKEWFGKGVELIRQNSVGVILMAGGQGTRLGSSAPKGCYDIGLPSKKSLFQLQAECILRLQKLAGGSAIIPWYIMTSGPTYGPTKKFFEEKSYFGLDKKNIIFFEQGVLPCLFNTGENGGKIIMESKSKVAVAPNGNGGLYDALITSGAIQDMKNRGLKHLHAYCVDNCLARVADPVFMAISASKNVFIGTKVVRKVKATEPVGIIIQKNKVPGVIEYSELDDKMAKEKDNKNPELLKFRMSNIVNHYYSLEFLESISEWSHRLPRHIANKKIPFMDETGKRVEPKKPNGIKLEMFVFDCFAEISMDRFVAFEVLREDEFSPLKNGLDAKEDNPETSMKDIMSQGRRWIEQAGGVVEDEGDRAGVEVSPLISYAGEDLDFVKGTTIKAPAVLEKPMKK